VALARLGPPPGGRSWSSEACDDWAARFGGTTPGGKIGKALKPLVDKHGWPEVRKAWKSYLGQVEADYASPSRFANTYGRWSGSEPEGGAAPLAVAAARGSFPSRSDKNRAAVHEFVTDMRKTGVR
jgi:hypothetical protein